MSNSILDLLGSQLGGANLQQISQILGTAPDATNKAISGALPMLLSGLAKNAAQPEGASALHKALDSHDGGLLDSAMDLFQGLSGANGDGILGHVLGDRRETAERGLSKMSGLDTASIGRLLALLAPLVMSALSKQRNSGGLGVDGLQDLLNREHRQVEERDPGLMGTLGKLLDRDNDGSFMDEAMQMGGSLLGGLFGKR